MISHRIADAARDKAVLVYESLLPRWTEGSSALAKSEAKPSPKAKPVPRKDVPAEDF